MKKTIEEELYERLCVGCSKEKFCHENCENCEEYKIELEKLQEVKE